MNLTTILQYNKYIYEDASYIRSKIDKKYIKHLFDCDEIRILVNHLKDVIEKYINPDLQLKTWEKQLEANQKDIEKFRPAEKNKYCLVKDIFVLGKFCKVILFKTEPDEILNMGGMFIPEKDNYRVLMPIENLKRLTRSDIDILIHEFVHMGCVRFKDIYDISYKYVAYMSNLPIPRQNIKLIYYKFNEQFIDIIMACVNKKLNNDDNKIYKYMYNDRFRYCMILKQHLIENESSLNKKIENKYFENTEIYINYLLYITMEFKCIMYTILISVYNLIVHSVTSMISESFENIYDVKFS